MTTLAYEVTAREHFSRELEELRQAGLFKEERYIHTPQGAEIDVEFPAGSPAHTVINMCSNNYLGLRCPRRRAGGTGALP